MLIASAITLSIITPTLNVIAEAISLIEARVSYLLCVVPLWVRVRFRVVAHPLLNFISCCFVLVAFCFSGTTPSPPRYPWPTAASGS